MAAGVIGYIGRLRLAEGDDADLLRAYARERDGEAFAALVRRHGGRVWATCRRVAGDPHAAEDAFQATFLVLARKATVLPASHPLGGWLHAVAVNVSVRARTAADRRRRREVGEVETAAPEPPDPPDERALAALDEEVERLPAKLRDAVVLCELDGLSRKEAAARLGVAEGTLSSRLAAARKRLAERLTDRGVRPELLAVPATVPAGLAAAVCGPPSAAVLALTGGSMRALLLKGLAAGAVACGLLAAGLQASDEPPAKPTEPPQVAKPVPVREGVILLTSSSSDQRPALYQPDGTELPQPTFNLGRGTNPTRLSPDGLAVATHRTDHTDYFEAVRRDGSSKPDATTTAATEYRKAHPWDRCILRLSPLFGDPTGEPLVDAPGVTYGAWSADGRRYYFSQIDPGKATTPVPDGEPAAFVSWVYDVQAKTRTPLPLPPAWAVLDVSADGKLFLARSSFRTRAGRHFTFRTAVVPADTFRPSPVLGDDFHAARLSPDGTRVLGSFRSPATGQWPERYEPAVVRLNDGSVSRLKLPAEDATGHYATGSWSPDGQRLALLWAEGMDPSSLPALDRRPLPQPAMPPSDSSGQGPQRPARVYAPRVSVGDADGTKQRVIVRRSPGLWVDSIDWR